MAAASLAPPTPTGPVPGSPLRTLAGIAAYRCGHTGSCCRAGWPIPIEPAPLQLLRRAEAEGLLPVASRAPWFDDGIVGRTAEQHCVFHAPEGREGGCELETALGASALPYSCRQFPRLLLADGRGWHVSLSAWCGTAARLITASVPTAARADGEPPNFLSFTHISADERVHLESLDARDAWPPLLRPGVLAGLEAYERWESRLLTEWMAPVSEGHRGLSDTLADAIRWTEIIRAWGPADGALIVRAGRPWHRRIAPAISSSNLAASSELDSLLKTLMSRVPAEWQAPRWPEGLTDATSAGAGVTRTDADVALARYLAVRLSGSWVAYQGRGLRSVMASLVSSYALAALALVRNGEGVVTIGRLTSAVRAADWLQLHLLERDAWASWCSECEDSAAPASLLSLVAAAGQVLDRLAWQPAFAGEETGRGRP